MVEVDSNKGSVVSARCMLTTIFKLKKIFLSTSSRTTAFFKVMVAGYRELCYKNKITQLRFATRKKSNARKSTYTYTLFIFLFSTIKTCISQSRAGGPKMLTASDTFVFYKRLYILKVQWKYLSQPFFFFVRCSRENV